MSVPVVDKDGSGVLGHKSGHKSCVKECACASYTFLPYVLPTDVKTPKDCCTYLQQAAYNGHPFGTELAVRSTGCDRVLLACPHNGMFVRKKKNSNEDDDSNGDETQGSEAKVCETQNSRRSWQTKNTSCPYKIQYRKVDGVWGMVENTQCFTHSGHPVKVLSGKKLVDCSRR